MAIQHYYNILLIIWDIFWIWIYRSQVVLKHNAEFYKPRKKQIKCLFYAKESPTNIPELYIPLQLDELSLQCIFSEFVYIICSVFKSHNMET